MIPFIDGKAWKNGCFSIKKWISSSDSNISANPYTWDYNLLLQSHLNHRHVFSYLSRQDEQHGKSAVTLKYLHLWAICPNLASSREAQTQVISVLWWFSWQIYLHRLSLSLRSGMNYCWTVQWTLQSSPLPFLQLLCFSAEKWTKFSSWY